MDNLPEGVRRRAATIFLFLSNYILEILTLKGNDSLPQHFHAPSKNDDFVTILYNDEIHTYDQVSSLVVLKVYNYFACKLRLLMH